MKNKKLLIAVVALVAVVAVMLGIFFMTRPEAQVGAKTITVTVVHKDGTAKEFTSHTDEEYLGPVLLAEEIAEGEMGEFGLFIQSVDGEVADWNVDNSFWAIYENGVSAVTGADQIVVVDGGEYRLEYTIG